MSFTRQQWCLDFLGGLGNKKPSQTALDFVSGWTAFETPNGATSNYYNLLNTTYILPGQTRNNYNSVGVQRFATYADGIAANVETIQNPYYPAILAALRTNADSVLSDPSSAILAQLRIWCGGCGYGRGFVSSGPAHLGDVFSYGNRENVPTAPPAPSGSSSTSTSGSTDILGISNPLTGVDELIATVQSALNPVRWAKAVLGMILVTLGGTLVLLIFVKKIVVPVAQDVGTATSAITNPIATTALLGARNASRQPRTIVTPERIVTPPQRLPAAPQRPALQAPILPQDMPTAPMNTAPFVAPGPPVPRLPPTPPVRQPVPAARASAFVSPEFQALDTEEKAVLQQRQDLVAARQELVAQAREALDAGDTERARLLRERLHIMAKQARAARAQLTDIGTRRGRLRLAQIAREARESGIMKPPSGGTQP